MTFRQFIQQLAEKIGLHQIPVVANASEIRYFLAEDAVHHQFVTTLVRKIYKSNRCGHLDAVLDQDKTMSLLGKLRAELFAEDDADICKVRLMNQFCDFSTTILSKEQAILADTTTSNDKPTEMAKG